MILSPT